MKAAVRVDVGIAGPVPAVATTESITPAPEEERARTEENDAQRVTPAEDPPRRTTVVAAEPASSPRTARRVTIFAPVVGALVDKNELDRGASIESVLDKDPTPPKKPAVTATAAIT